MTSFFSRIGLCRKRPRDAKPQQASRKWYKKCFGRSRPSPPSSKQKSKNHTETSIQESTPSPAPSDMPSELASFQGVLERAMSRLLAQRRAVQLSKQALPQPTDNTYPGQAVERRHRARTSSVTVMAPMPFHSVDEAFDKELAELSKLRSDCLAHLCSVHGKERDPDGYVTLQSHGGYYVMLSQYTYVLVPVTSYRLVRINSLPASEQNLHYETALSRAATLAEVRAQYEMHLWRLECVRKKVGQREEASRGLRRLGNRNYDVWFNAHLKEPQGVTTIEGKADMAAQAGRRAFDVRLSDAVVERGVMRLLERCEVILKRSDPTFVPIVWARELRSRWADARPGWTGLDLQDLSCNSADGEDN